MNTLKFKTSIKCGGCVNAVEKPLNETVGVGNWEVDLASSDKILTVNNADSQQVIDILKKVGYEAEEV